MAQITVEELDSWLRWQGSFPWLRRWALPVFRAAYENPITPWAGVLAVRGIERIEGERVGFPLWLEMLNHPDPAVATQTAHCMREPRFAMHLIQRFTQGIPIELALAILHSLGQTKSPAALPILVACLARPEFRICSIEALGALNQPAAIPHLEPWLNDESVTYAQDHLSPPPTVGELAGRSIGRLRKV